MKYSRQREIIHHTVLQNAIHPTADMVYTMVRAQEPNISLGTVYRNLNLLAEQGLLKKICIPNASDHFDGRVDDHNHILCEKCGHMFDIDIGDLSILDKIIEKESEFIITGYEVLLTGICPDCQTKNDKRKEV